MKWIFCAFMTFCVINGCSPKNTQALITFSPISIDVTKLSQGDYSELIQSVNASYDGGTHKYTKAEVLRDETIFTYYKLTLETSEECCRVSVDKNKRAIVNMQPDCPVTK